MPDDLLDVSGRPLNLREPAASAARALKAAHPGIVFTSGRRDLRAQSRAMAQNIAAYRKRTGKLGHNWLTLTYRPSPALSLMVAWCKSHSALMSWSPISQGLLSILMSLPPDEAGRISKHLSGLAFDIAPVFGAEGLAIRKTISELPHLDKFLDEEGGLSRFHIQMKSLPEEPT